MLALIRPACASTILFSNLVQPGNQYGPDGVGIGHTPAFPNAGDYLIYAVPFTSGATAVLTALEVPLGVIAGSNQLQAFLMNDSAGAPGATIESFALSNLPLPPGPFPLLTIASQLTPSLSAGQQYWFAVTGGVGTFGSWMLTVFQGDPMDGGASRIVVNGVEQAWIVGTGSRTGALQVSGTLVPEPSYTALLGGIIILLGIVRYSAAG